jgi:hypothetical protein
MIAFIILMALVVITLYSTGRSGNLCGCGCGCVEGKCTCNGCKCEICKRKWIVYGTNWCGWTTKQIEYMKKNNKAFEFIDCEKGQCNGIKSFPTLMSPNGEKITGYREI